jgi:outer membrane receptor for ferrienterochelin and colicins
MGRTIPPGTPGATPGAARTLEVESKVLDSKLVLPWGTHLTTLGGQWWDAEMKDGVAPNKFAFTQKALFAEDEWSLSDAFKLTMGARYDRHSLFGGKLSPRLYGVWNAAPQWTVKGGISNGYKTPRVEQLAPGINGFGQQGRLPLVGSPNLKPETSRTTELGVYFDSPTGFSGSATVFNNEFKDKITSGPGLINCNFAAAPNRPGCVSFGDWPLVDAFGQQINVDEAVTRGLELSARMPLAPGWNASANYTFTKSEQKSGPNRGSPLSDTPRHALNARLNWEPGALGRAGQLQALHEVPSGRQLPREQAVHHQRGGLQPVQQGLRGLPALQRAGPGTGNPAVWQPLREQPGRPSPLDFRQLRVLRKRRRKDPGQMACPEPGSVKPCGWTPPA